MKNKQHNTKAGLCSLAVTLLCSLSASAQDYSIGWYSIDGGGGTSSGGDYTVSGTIGQSDASQKAMTGGDYALTGGFWSLFAIQTPGAPLLTIVPSGAIEATLSWTPDGAGWVLQERTSLGSGDWVDSPTSTNPIVVPSTSETKFYRLSKP